MLASDSVSINLTCVSFVCVWSDFFWTWCDSHHWTIHIQTSLCHLDLPSRAQESQDLCSRQFCKTDNCKTDHFKEIWQVYSKDGFFEYSLSLFPFCFSVFYDSVVLYLICFYALWNIKIRLYSCVFVCVCVYILYTFSHLAHSQLKYTALGSTPIQEMSPVPSWRFQPESFFVMPRLPARRFCDAQTSSCRMKKEEYVQGVVAGLVHWYYSSLTPVCLEMVADTCAFTSRPLASTGPVLSALSSCLWDPHACALPFPSICFMLMPEKKTYVLHVIEMWLKLFFHVYIPLNQYIITTTCTKKKCQILFLNWVR